MNPGRFYIPPYMGMGNSMIANNIRTTVPMMNIANNTSRGMGFFSKITNGIRSVNWGGLLNNANKTLNVVNQTIPLVRQAGPMVNNMKSMLRIAKAFGNETSNNKINNKKSFNNNMTISNNIDVINSNNPGKKENTQYDNVPNFFV